MRDVFRPWPGAMRESNYRRDSRTSCERAVNFVSTPLGGEDPESAGGRRRGYYLQATPGIETNGRGDWWLPKHPCRGALGTANGIYASAGGFPVLPPDPAPPPTGRRAPDPGSFYQLFGPLSRLPGVQDSEVPQLVGNFAGPLANEETQVGWLWEIQGRSRRDPANRPGRWEPRTPPPLAQIAWSGPQVGIVAVVANGKLNYYDEQIAATADGMAAARGTEAAGWFADVLGDTLDSNLIAVQFFNNYFFILDDRNRLFASPILGRNRNPPITGAPLGLSRTNSGTGAVERYAFDISQVQQRSLEPDPWRAMIALSDVMLLFGRVSGGTWQLKPEGGAGFPLQRILAGQFQCGVLTQGSVAALGDTAYWVGGSPDGQVRAWRYSPDAGLEGVSSPPVDEYLAVLSSQARNAARCTATAIAGRRCFALRFDHYRSASRRRELSATWCYDDTTGLWHERGVWDEGREEWMQWEVVFAATYNERTWVFADDATTGMGPTLSGSSGPRKQPGFTPVGYLVIYRSTQGRVGSADGVLNGKVLNPFTGSPGLYLATPAAQGFIRRERITPHWGTRASLQSVRGVRVSVGAGAGEVELSISHDGGETFGRAFDAQAPPPGGECVWYACGAGRDPVLKVVMTGRSAAINNIWANVQRLRN